MTRLSVNVNKIATLRNARGGNVPNVLQVALDCERFGAEGITVHPRPDERHIRYSDVREIRPRVQTEFNIEGYPSEPFVRLVREVHPDQVTLVPDPPQALTSNAGWDTKTHLDFLKDIILPFKEDGIRVSVFVDALSERVEYAALAGADRVELYTEPYASHFHEQAEEAVRPFVLAAEAARSFGLGLNAGHDLNLDNLHFLKEHIPYLDEVSIGHALISDALYFGLEQTIKKYKEQLR